jgi:hypothetical protein
MEEEAMKRTDGLTEDYGKYCDTGAASGQSECGQTAGENCGMDAASGQCEFSDRIADERGYYDTGAASGQSMCGQTECDDCCCC